MAVVLQFKEGNPMDSILDRLFPTPLRKMRQGREALAHDFELAATAARRSDKRMTRGFVAEKSGESLLHMDSWRACLGKRKREKAHAALGMGRSAVCCWGLFTRNEENMKLYADVRCLKAPRFGVKQGDARRWA